VRKLLCWTVERRDNRVISILRGVAWVQEAAGILFAGMESDPLGSRRVVTREVRKLSRRQVQECGLVSIGDEYFLRPSLAEQVVSRVGIGENVLDSQEP